MIKITDKPIEVKDALEGSSSLSAGAINVFVGNIRETSGGKRVLWLEYEAFESMAVSEIKKIIDQAKSKWEIKGFAVIHRIGTLKPGETAVVVAVSTGHRKESFEACSFIIDSLKQTVPIFKKEVFENGEEWVSAHP
ncbi:MAG: molybdenum cofactor biosynthesis protein MoaE [Bacteroidetes bacterium]|nr:molybdenum cofactor biosynthesis protein MoaE [Bacteroidota bacterium]